MVVTVSPEGVSALAVATKDEARVLALKTTQRVTMEHARPKSKDPSGFD